MGAYKLVVRQNYPGICNEKFQNKGSNCSKQKSLSDDL